MEVEIGRDGGGVRQVVELGFLECRMNMADGNSA